MPAERQDLIGQLLLYPEVRRALPDGNRLAEDRQYRRRSGCDRGRSGPRCRQPSLTESIALTESTLTDRVNRH